MIPCISEAIGARHVKNPPRPARPLDAQLNALTDNIRAAAEKPRTAENLAVLKALSLGLAFTAEMAAAG